MANRQQIVVSFALVALSLVIYGQTLTHEFVSYDDPLYVTDNPHVNTGLSVDNVVWAFTTNHMVNWHPITWISHELDCQIYGLRPWGHHLTNFLFHAVNSVLLFFVLLRLTRGRRGTPRLSGRGEDSVWTSALAAACFAVHPLHVESVAWVAERKDVLSAFFWLLALDAYTRYAAAPGARRYGAVVLWFVLGLMSKPMVVTLPCVLLLLDYWPLGRFEGANGIREFVRRGARLAVEKAPLFALAAAVSVVTYVVQKRGGNLEFGETAPVLVRVTNVPVAYAFYLAKTFWPSDLAVFYPLPLTVRPWWLIAGSALLLLAASVIVLAERKRRPYLMVGWLWYLGTLVPVVGFVQTGRQAYADRYTYIPSIGLFLIGAWYLREVASQSRACKTAVLCGAMLTVAILTVAAAFQTHYWQSNEALFERALDVTTDNFVAHNNLGVTLQQQGKYKEALDHLTEAVKIAPTYVDAHNNLGLTLLLQGKNKEALAHLTEAIRLNPRCVNAYYNLGNFLSDQGNPEEAIKYYQKAIDLDPWCVRAHNNLGSELAKLGRMDEAAAHFAKAIRIDPDFAFAHRNLADLLAAQGKLGEAVNEYIETIRLDPRNRDAYFNIAVAMVRQGKPDAAIECYSTAIKIDPEFAQAHHALGALYLSLQKYGEAKRHFQRALQLDPTDTAAQKGLEKASAVSQ